jgi:hypothetical protein
MVRPGILSNDEDEVRLDDVLKGDAAFSDADRL